MAMTKIVMDGTKIEVALLGNQIAFRPHSRNETSKGVLLPENARTGMEVETDQTPSGTVLAVGPDVKTVKVGDLILFGKGTPVCQIRRGNVKFLTTPEDSVVSVFRDI